MAIKEPYIHQKFEQTAKKKKPKGKDKKTSLSFLDRMAQAGYGRDEVSYAIGSIGTALSGIMEAGNVVTEADLYESIGEEELRSGRLVAREKVGAEIARQGASGLTVGTGSNLGVIAETAGEGERAAQAAAGRYRIAAAQRREEANLILASSLLTAGAGGMAMSIGSMLNKAQLDKDDGVIRTASILGTKRRPS